MRTLDKKLVRDLKRLWAQVLAIGLVVAAGVATYVLALGSYRSLAETRAAYYERYRFADIFAQMTRAPLGLREQVAEIPGVLLSETRIARAALLDIPGFAPPATARVISLPDHGEPVLNRLYVREGRLPEPARVDEVVINEAFANAHSFKPGSVFSAILNGRRQQLHVTGIALSPEFIYAVGPGDLMPDDKRFAVLWMSEEALEASFDLEGAFNDVSLKLEPGANQQHAMDRLDSLIARYGGAGAYDREDQTSHAFIDAELKQLSAMSRIIPPIFLFVSAFLINITLSRLVALEREQIGLLKALGYQKFAIAWHYLKFVLLIAVLGIAVGVAAGNWLGGGLTRLYGDFFHFPFLIFRRDLDVITFAAAVSAFAAVAGALKAVREVVELSPAVAMQPPAPQRYRQYFTDKIPLLRHFSQLTIMALRSMLRRPLRTGLTLTGLSLAVAILVTALFTFDAVDYLIDATFFRTNRQHATLNLVDNRSPAVVAAIASMPGVIRAEPYRAVSVKLRNGTLERRVAVVGKPEERDLSLVVDRDFVPVELPKHGIVVSERLAEVLQVNRGNAIEAEVLEGRRQTITFTISDIVKSYVGLGAYANIDALNQELDEGSRVSGVHISYDTALEDDLFTAVKNTPMFASIALQKASLDQFRKTLAQNINIMTTVYVTLSCIIAFGVVYNSARIQLSERARDLASLRVLGFTRAEVSRVLLTELALLTLLASPFGWIIGYGFAALTTNSFSSDLYTVPLIVDRATFALSSLIVIAAALLSALAVRRRLDSLDLITVLKTRD